ncbi:MAG: TetR/AcrR family transcriptional repressor of nem operon [Flavobacteriales bacterium]|jgi:TetR/AcrR family transcriptional repressor of nem operon
MARTIQFDRDDVLNKAMQTFWSQGYTQTSIPDLVKATNLQPGSLYAAFKSKEGLLLATLEKYHSTGLAEMRASFECAASPLEGIKNLLLQVVEEVVSDTRARGCFVINTLLEFSPDNTDIQGPVRGYLDDIEQEIVRTLKLALSQGELSADKDPELIAKFIMVNIWGLRVFGKTQADQAQGQFIYQQLISML